MPLAIEETIGDIWRAHGSPGFPISPERVAQWLGINISQEQLPSGVAGMLLTQQPPSKDGGMRLRPPPTESRRNVGACANTSLGMRRRLITKSTSAAKADRLKAGGFNLKMDIKQHPRLAPWLRR